jgi:catechol 2,3-dioxygenase-like lactoylglutathione lyase family enzyme
MIFTAQVNPGDGVNAAPTTPYQGLDHFGLSVSGIDAIAADLKKKGVEFTQEPHSPRPGIKICFLRGPQGISIELLDRDPKYS